MKKIISVNRLSKHYGAFTAIKGISFDVKSGEIFGLVGPNGAGKTTLINMLCTILTPTSGSAKLNNFDIRVEKNQVRSSIGIVFQDPSLDLELTALENLYFHSMLYDMPRPLFAARAQELLSLVELSDRAASQVKTFSGGMKRRLEIARGLIHHPKILFLDEPTIGLDPQTRFLIWRHLRQLRDREGVTIFATTHYLPETENADRIAIIDSGKIIGLGSPSALKRRYRSRDMDEVFIKATGHGIRDEELSRGDQAKDRFKRGDVFRR
ncbi:ATP-binding cassette domain-containing protein [Candidatus Berkelbacteria bacterium]|nr:ATP-binding cassette domain-containing protein [Candidatus Berkelbacteria bacterium]